MHRTLAALVTASSLACSGASSTSMSPTTPGSGASSSTIVRATTFDSFEGLEEPAVLYHPASGTFTPDGFVNMSNPSAGTFRSVLRYRPACDGWDGDWDTANDDR